MKINKVIHTGSKLKVLRIKAKLTAQELADKADLDRATVSLIENGHRSPRPETAIKLAIGLGLEVESAEEAAQLLGLKLASN